MYSAHNEGKIVVYMTSILKNLYIYKYNNTYHSTIKMKSVDVKSNTYIDASKEIIDKDPDDIVRTSKYKGYAPNWSEEIFVIKKVKNTVPWTYIISDVIGTFYKTELQKANQKQFRIERVIKTIR